MVVQRWRQYETFCNRSNNLQRLLSLITPEYHIKNLLKDIHALTTDHVRAYSGWYVVNNNSTLTTSTDMVIKAINPNAAGNLGLVNQHKIRLRRITVILYFTFKNNVTRTSYTSSQPNKDKFVYKDNITGREITCGLTLLNMAMTVMKPQLVVNHRGKQRDLEELTLAKSGNNDPAYLTNMQEKRKKIDALLKDNVKFYYQRWLKLTFEQLIKTGCSGFLEDVKRQ